MTNTKFTFSPVGSFTREGLSTVEIRLAIGDRRLGWAEYDPAVDAHYVRTPLIEKRLEGASDSLDEAAERLLAWTGGPREWQDEMPREFTFFDAEGGFDFSVLATPVEYWWFQETLFSFVEDRCDVTITWVPRFGKEFGQLLVRATNDDFRAKEIAWALAGVLARINSDG